MGDFSKDFSQLIAGSPVRRSSRTVGDGDTTSAGDGDTPRPSRLSAPPAQLEVAQHRNSAEIPGAFLKKYDQTERQKSPSVGGVSSSHDSSLRRCYILCYTIFKQYSYTASILKSAL
jgi:hypothetical protein